MFLTPRKPQAQVWVRPGRDPGSHLWAAPSACSRPSSPQAVPRGSWGGSQAPSPGRAASKDHPPGHNKCRQQDRAQRRGQGQTCCGPSGGAARRGPWRCDAKPGGGLVQLPPQGLPRSARPAVWPQALTGWRR